MIMLFIDGQEPKNKHPYEVMAGNHGLTAPISLEDPLRVVLDAAFVDTLLSCTVSIYGKGLCLMIDTVRHAQHIVGQKLIAKVQELLPQA